MRQYYGVEVMSLTAQQRSTLVDALKQLGDNAHPNAAWRNHWRVRTDNLAVIFEASFDDSDWTVAGIKSRLATLFGISASIITDSTQQTAYGPVVTFGAGGIDRLRLVAFGGLLATWAESHTAVLAYLAANGAAWGEGV